MKKIKLTQGKYALVDDMDFIKVNKYIWAADFDGFNWYAKRNVVLPSGKRSRQLMHVFLMGKRKGLEIDHRNRNSLDNQRSNLRFLSHSKNLMNRGRPSNNTSGYTGVSFHKMTGKYHAYGNLHRKRVHLGLFSSIIKARSAYQQFAEKHYKI